MGCVTRNWGAVVAPDAHSGVALEKIKADSGKWNKTLATLRQEQEEATREKLSPPKVPQELAA